MITYAQLPPGQGAPLPSREATCTHQMSTILMVIRELQPFLLKNNLAEIHEEPVEFDGGASCAALATFVKACSRLDEMLDDKSRWNLKENDELYQAMTAQFKTATKVNENQIAAIARIQSPAVRLKPSLTTLGNEFIAFLSTSDLPGGTIIGKGKTPSLALEDFNAAFDREVEQQLRFAAASEARINPDVDAEVVPENKKKKTRKRKSGY